MPHRESRANDCEVVHVPIQGFQIYYLNVFHLVDLQKVYQLLNGRDLAILKTVLFVCFVIIVNLRTVAPEKVFLRALYKPS